MGFCVLSSGGYPTPDPVGREGWGWGWRLWALELWSLWPSGCVPGSPSILFEGAFLPSSRWALCVHFVPTTGGWAGTQLGSVTGPYRLMEEGMCVCVCVCVCV